METIVDYKGNSISATIGSMIATASKSKRITPYFTHLGSIEAKKNGISKLVKCHNCRTLVFLEFDICKCWRAIEWEP